MTASRQSSSSAATSRPSSSASDHAATGPTPPRAATPSPETPMTGGLEWGRIVLFFVIAAPIFIGAILYRIYG